MDRLAEIEAKINAVDTAKSPVKAANELLATFPEDYLWLVDEVHKARNEAGKLREENQRFREENATLVRLVDSDTKSITESEQEKNDLKAENQRMRNEIVALRVLLLTKSMVIAADSMKEFARAALEKMKAIRPKIVCLCGPMRFMEAYRQAEYDLEMQGVIVLAPSFLPGAAQHDGTTGCTPEQKIMLDELHKQKIDMADRILVLNVGGYIGSSTRSEIDYALANGKPVTYLEPIIIQK